MTVGVLIQDDSLTLRVEDAPVAPPLPLGAEALARIDAIAARYRRLERRNDPELALELGRTLYALIDAGDGRLARAIDAGGAPLLLELHCPAVEPSPAEWSLLHAPWELLANGRGHLAADPLLQFAPWRRLGPRGEPALPDDGRLGLCFMAASPPDQHELDFEAEEQAILSAVGRTDLDLVVEESGEPTTLGRTLRESDRLPALHLSCHGLAAWREAADRPPRPVLMLEDGAFGPRPTDAPALLAALRPQPPRLLFLSACQTAQLASPAAWPPAPGHKEGETRPAAAAPVHSLTTALIRAGLPAVLGWDGSVADRAATAFAATLYDRLAQQEPLSLAVASARAALLSATDKRICANWHLARLWLGRAGEATAPFVVGRRKRSLLPADHVQKQLLAKEVPVAAHGYFVGRRRELQGALAALAGADHPGVLLTGMGRLGKSSLAARIVNRLRDRVYVAAVYGPFGIPLLLERLAEALADHPAAAALLTEQVPAVQAALPQGEAAALAALRPLLFELLGGPCQQRDGQGPGRPLLLVLDDFEQLLEEAPGPRPVGARHAGLIRLLLEAFDPSRGDSRLLITSRFPFTLAGPAPAPAAGLDPAARLHPIALGSFRDTEQAKLSLRQQSAARDRASAFSDLPAREALLPRAVAAARGNPGLMDLIGAGLLLNPDVPLAQARRALEEMEGHLAGGAPPTHEALRDLLERIAADHLLALAGPRGRELLRALTLFPLPLPAAVIAALAQARGGRPEALEALGLLEPGLDPVAPKAPARRVSPLAAGRLPPLTEADQGAVATLALAPLHAARRAAADIAGRWPAAVELELCHLARLAPGHAEAPGIVTRCGAAAVRALESESYTEAAALARGLLDLLAARDQPPPPRLVAHAARVIGASGDGDLAQNLLAGSAGETAPDGADAIALAYQRGQDAQQRGELEAAERHYRDAIRHAEAMEHDHSIAVTQGAIADILKARGQLDEALRIRLEEELPVYERLGDVREKAVTQGKIADILKDRGQLDEALRIRLEEELPVYERLGDVRATAVTQRKIADILEAKGDFDGALRLLQNHCLPAAEALGAVADIAVFQGRIADILHARGQLDEALRIRLEEQLPVYERLGDVRAKAVTQGQIADILHARGQLDEALRIRLEEQLPVYERLGDVRAKAVTQGQIADILKARGQLDEALRIHLEEQLPVYERLGDVREKAVALKGIADIEAGRGNFAAAAQRILDEVMPLIEPMGAIRDMAVFRAQAALYLLQQGGRASQANALLCRALADARRLRLPEADQIQQLLDQTGLTCPDAPP